MEFVRHYGSISEKLSHQFLRILDQISKDEEEIRARIVQKRRVLGIPETQSKPLIKRCVDSAVIRSAGAGVASALPITLPVIGAIPTFLGVVTANTLYTYKNEIELCYSIAFATNTPLRGEELKHRVFWIVGLSNIDEVKRQAREIGVKITLKTLVQKLAVASASRGLAHFIHCGIGEAIGLSAMTNIPKTLGFFIGAPIGGYFGYRSTRGVAERAVEFFK